MHPSSTRALSAAIAVVLFAPAAQAQLITPKTVPIHQGQQFGIYPSQWPGMGGTGIALVDSLGDPWVNPAKAMRIRTGSLQVMPFTHSATAGGGRSLPVSLLQTNGRLSFGLLYSPQELERRNVWWSSTLADRTAANTYYTALLAGRIGSGWALGTSIAYADLGGVDGVSSLYASSDRVRQSGNQVDTRIGLTREFTNGSVLEVAGSHYRYRMTHDVHFPQLVQPLAPCVCPQWGPCDCEMTTVAPRTEVNQDRTNAVGLQAVFLPPVTENGWRVGYQATATRLSHPKIPNYQLQNIPRDPGFTNAFNAGVGMVRTLGRSTFALDIVMEPIFSRTWADAARDTLNVEGQVLRQGAHTVDNRFRFSNSRIGVGFGHDFDGSPDSSLVFGIQYGVNLRTIRYRLDQDNHVALTSRTQNESWTEWTPTIAFRLHSNSMELSYAIIYTCGPTCPSGRFFGGDDVSVAPPAEPGVIAAPSSALSFDGGSASQHRFMVSIHWR